MCARLCGPGCVRIVVCVVVCAAVCVCVCVFVFVCVRGVMQVQPVDHVYETGEAGFVVLQVTWL